MSCLDSEVGTAIAEVEDDETDWYPLLATAVFGINEKVDDNDAVVLVKLSEDEVIIGALAVTTT